MAVIDKIPAGAEFEAEYRGERLRFEKGEHANIGNGWWCRRMDWKPGANFKPVVHSREINIVLAYSPIKGAFDKETAV